MSMDHLTRLGTTDLHVSRLCLGGNVFGWTATAAESAGALDAFLAAGGNFIDTADSYSQWADGNSGGESETILGEWMAARRSRDQVVLATKVGEGRALRGLAPDTIRAAVDASLGRLQTDAVDILYAHFDDQTVPLADTLGTFDEIVRAGKARCVAASKYSAARLAAALDIQAREGWAPFVALSHHYNLMRRDVYEGELEQLCAAHSLAFVPFFALASGFLTGKYRTVPVGGTAREPYVTDYLADPRGPAVLAALDQIAASHRVSQAAVALAWLAAKPGVIAPIASARTAGQALEITAVLSLELSPADLAALDAASAGQPTGAGE
jgi:aryl-alcohol dehydrogenase-like predicted oxidoreductase